MMATHNLSHSRTGNSLLRIRLIQVRAGESIPFYADLILRQNFCAPVEHLCRAAKVGMNVVYSDFISAKKKKQSNEIRDPISATKGHERDILYLCDNADKCEFQLIPRVNSPLQKRHNVWSLAACEVATVAEAGNCQEGARQI
jgi:hypothetical protein